MRIRRFALVAAAVVMAAPAVSAQTSGDTSMDPSATTTTTYSGHGAGSVPPETLARFAPPPIDPATRTKVQAMLDVRAPGSGILSEDGDRMFFGWAVTGVPHVWRLDKPGGFPVQMTGGEDPTYIEAVMPGGEQILVSRDRGGAENPGLYLQPADGGALTPVFAAPGVQAYLGFVSDDGRSIYYRANDRKPDTYSFYRYDVATAQREALYEPDEGYWYLADHRDDGKTLLLGKATGSSTTEFYELDVATKALTGVLGQDAPEEYSAAYGREDGRLLVLTNRFGDFRRLYGYTYRGYATEQFDPITPEMNHDVEGFSIDRDRERILYSVNEGGYTRLHGLTADRFRPLRLPEFDGADHVSAGSTTHNGRFTTLRAETARSPMSAYVYEWKTRKLVRWHTPSAPEVDTTTFAVSTLEFYPARDGTQIPMFVRRPEGCDTAETPCPVVVSFHGGPEGQSVPGFSTIAQLYVDAGFIYVQPNVRGSEGYGKAWLHADDGPKRLDVITDIEDAATYIRANWGRNGIAPKIGVAGGSYGGYAALMAMSRFAGAYDAGVSVVGMSNLLTFLENTAPYRRALRITEYGDPEKDRDALIALSPSTYVDQVKAPLLIIQGANDPRVPVGEAIQIHDQLKSRGIDAPLIVFADEGHGSVKRENRVLEAGHILEFFARHLK